MMDLASERAYPTPAANSPLLPLLLLSLMRQKNAPRVTGRRRMEYDYIIVGAGSAGSTVAGRLTELRCASVLLLEAGKSPPVLTDVPGYGFLFIDSDITWQYKTEPQKHTGNGLVNRQVPWPSGKTLGGSSTINLMQYIRGNKKDYDNWAAQGAKGWSYKEIFPYFLKSEGNRDTVGLDAGYHSSEGPLSVQRPPNETEWKTPAMETAEKLGYKLVDCNGETQTGICDVQLTARDQQRCSTAKAYLVPAENRTNLDILTNAHVKKIVIERGRATGVIFEYANVSYEVRASGEVIMSAGTIGTAQLLMLSGIGPKDHLRELGIPVVIDLPVGNNLQDHLGTYINFQMNPGIPTLLEKLANQKNLDEYIRHRSGPLTIAGGVAAVAFLNGESVSPKIDSPNYQLFFLEGSTVFFKNSIGLKPEVYRQVFEPYENTSFFSCWSIVIQPKSRGTIRLRSIDPNDPPLIDPNYLEDPQDVQAIVQGMKTCNKIGRGDPMLKIGSKPFKTLYPGCEEYEGDEDKYAICQARSVASTIYHKAGTAKMGDPNDPTTVVDPQLRVKGVQGLRVVDASVMPVIVSGNTNAATIMIAEKASDIIKENILCKTRGCHVCSIKN